VGQPEQTRQRKCDGQTVHTGIRYQFGAVIGFTERPAGRSWSTHDRLSEQHWRSRHDRADDIVIKAPDAVEVPSFEVVILALKANYEAGSPIVFEPSTRRWGAFEEVANRD
jgi:hypothetical protein